MREPQGFTLNDYLCREHENEMDRITVQHRLWIDKTKDRLADVTAGAYWEREGLRNAYAIGRRELAIERIKRQPFFHGHERK